MINQPQDGRFVTLASILAPLAPETPEAAQLEIRSCGISPDDAFRHGLFVCLADNVNQAEKEIDRAVTRGAVAVVVRRGLFSARRCSLFASFLFEVDEPLDVFGQACQILLDRPAEKLRLIAVTGTAGKTSLSYLIAGVLAEAGIQVGLIGSLGVYNGVTLVPGTETTPTADRLALRLAEMVENGCTHAIIEVSVQALAEHRIAGLKFDAICLTNIRRDHLDLLHTVEQYRKTKMKIFDYATPETLVVCNSDDRVTQAVLHLIDNPTITVGLRPSDSLVSGMPVEQNRGGQTFYIVAGNDAVPVHSKIIGTEHLYNCLLAAALGICRNIDLHTIVPGLERVEHIPGRLEQIDCGQPFAVFVDNATTPETLEATLKTVRSITSRRLYCVLGTPADGDLSKRPVLGQIASNMADELIITSADFATPASEDILNDVLKGTKNTLHAKTYCQRPEAIVWALSNASPDDTVVIIGTDPAVDEDATDEILSSRQFVRHWLYENQPSLEPFWF